MKFQDVEETFPILSRPPRLPPIKIERNTLNTEFHEEKSLLEKKFYRHFWNYP